MQNNCYCYLAGSFSTKRKANNNYFVFLLYFYLVGGGGGNLEQAVAFPQGKQCLQELHVCPCSQYFCRVPTTLFS